MNSLLSLFALIAVSLVPMLAHAQSGSVGQYQVVAQGSNGSSTSTVQRKFFVYQPLEVTETVTTTVEVAAAAVPLVVPTRRVHAKIERAPLIAFPRLQRRIAARTARTERAAAQTLAMLDPDDC